jgi:hypothetical protein
MLHLPYTLMVLSFVALGAALAPTIDGVLLAGTVLAYFLGLGLGAHLLDQVPGMGSRYVRHWSSRALWTGGLASLGGAVAIGVAGAVWYVGPALLPWVAVQTVCALGYPLARWFGGAFHRDSVFALSWGGLPFLTSYFAQSRTISGVSLVIAAILALVALAEIRLSRASRQARARARATGAALEDPGVFERFDRALRSLSTSTIAVGVGALAIRFFLGLG